MTDPGTARDELPLPEQIRTRHDFAAALTLLRDEAGLSVRDVARRSGVQGEHSTIGDWFAGKSLPSRSSVELLERVLAVCGVDDERVIQQWVSAWRRVRRVPGPQARGVEPYRGLSRYEPQDAEWFFGRKDLIAQLMRRVTRRHAADKGVHLVVGASGSGKSSLLRAGLIPALRNAAGPDGSWWPVLLTPEARTLDALADRLTMLGGLGRPDGLSAEAGGRQLVIVVDPLEEVFTRGDEAAQRRFITALFAAAEGEQGAVVVMSLRADFYAQALGHPELMAAIRSSQLTMGPMSEDELREVIVGPARRAGIALEDGLVELLLREVLPPAGADPSVAAHTAGVLPLLSHALHATWMQSGGRRLTVADYRATGGVDGAVAATAEKVYQGLAEEQRTLCRRLLVSLVHLAPGVVDTRRRVTQAELLSGCAPEQGTDLEDVLDQLIAERLVTTDFDTVEISHDALLGAWPRLRDWLDADRSGLLVGRQLTEAATAWLRDNRDPAALYRGGRLGAAQQWAADHGSDLSDTAREFLAGSARLARREVLRSRRIALALALLLVLTALTSVFALRSEGRAARQRDAALSAKVAGEAGALRQVNPALAAQLGLAAYRLVPTAEARGNLLSTFAAPYANQLPAPDSVYAAAFAPTGRLLAVVSRDGMVKLWDTTVAHRPSLLVAFRTGHVGNPASGAVDSAAFSADGRLLATGSWDHTTKLWDLAHPRRPRLLATLRGHSDNVRTVAFSPVRPLLATGSDDRTVRLWDVADPGHVRPLAALGGHRGSVRAVAFSPDGHVLAAGSDDDTVTTWDVTAPSRPAARARLPGRIGAVFSVAFSPRGHLLSAGTDDSSARLWDDSDPRRPRLRATLTGHDGAIFAVAFAPNGRTLATGSDDNTARLWSISDPRRPHLLYSLAGHSDTVLSAAFSPDGHTLATGSDDFTARLWDIATPPFATAASPVLSAAFRRDGRLLATGALNGDVTLWRVRRTGGPTAAAVVHGRIGAVYSVAFSHDGRLLAAGGINNRVRLWRLPDVRHPRPVASVTGLSVSFSPNGRLLATGGLDRRIRLWSITDPGRPAHLATVIGHANVVSSTEFSPNGRLLVTAGWDRTTRLWDVSDARHPLPLASTAGSVAAFSPDGRTLATADGDRLVRLWNVVVPHHPVQLAALTGHTNAVLSVAFSPDGRTLASAGGDRTIRMWDVADPRHPTDSATLTGHTDTVRAVAFSPDGHTLASAGSDSAVRLWETSASTVAARVCAVVHPSIAPEEWKQYFTGLPYRPPCR